MVEGYNIWMTNSDEAINVVVGRGGIARQLATLLLDRGEQVLILARGAAEGLDAPSKLLDFEKPETIAAAFGEILVPIKRVLICTGILHGNGEWGPERQWSELDAEILGRYFQVNTIGPSIVAKYALPKMSKDQRSIFCAFSARVSSISDNRLGGWYGYRSSKTALNMMLKNLAIEARRKRPKSIIIGYHPGTVDTALSKPFQRNVKPEKLFSPEFAADACLKVIDDLKAEDSGKLFDWQGLVIEP